MTANSVTQNAKPLRLGDKIGIIAPASSFAREAFDRGIARLRELGYEPVWNDSIFERDLYFAGRAERRVNELHEMFAREDIRVILCVRGGYGSNYLLPRLDARLIRANPKLFIGYSDNTSLLTYFADLGLPVIHGPMIKDFADPDGVDPASWHSATSGTAPYAITDHAATGLIAGEAEGILYGGCLSMLAASIGTQYEAQTEGKLLFMEDVATKPYQLDRMLMQMMLAGKFAGVQGIIFGEMLDCEAPADVPYTLPEIMLRILGGLNVPIAFGFRSGHVSRANISLPLGVPARISVEAEVSLQMLESGK